MNYLDLLLQKLSDKENELFLLENANSPVLSGIEKSDNDIVVISDNSNSKNHNKKEIANVKKEIKEIKSTIQRVKEQNLREEKVKELESKIPSTIKDTIEYRFAVDGYIMQNSAPNIGDITLTDDGKLIFKYGGIPEIDDGKQVFQVKDGHIYIYEERKAYDNYDRGENLTSLLVSLDKKPERNYGGLFEKLSVHAMVRGAKCFYKVNDEYNWKDITDISSIPFKDLLSSYAHSDEFKKFFNENYTPVIKKEPIKETIQEEKVSPILQGIEETDSGITIVKDVVTVEDLKKEYTYVFDNDSGIVTARKVEKRETPYKINFQDGTSIPKTVDKITDYLFFKDKNGIVTPIPELSYMEEGDINGNHFKSSNSSRWGLSRKGSHTFDVHEWGFEGEDENGKQIDRYDKHYRYITLDNSQKLVKVFESEHYIEKPWADLYHRNKDENGKQCIRLVDLQGNIHSIKEGGKVGEKGLKEKTFGARGDYQLKVVYKDKEPVYAIFMGDYGNEPNEFCTADELRHCYERQTMRLKRYGIYIDDDSCFAQMEEVIENFNETFMQGNFVPSIDKNKSTKETKSVSELADELSSLTKQEQQAKELLEQYEHQLPNNDKEL